MISLYDLMPPNWRPYNDNFPQSVLLRKYGNQVKICIFPLGNMEEEPAQWFVKLLTNLFWKNFQLDCWEGKREVAIDLMNCNAILRELETKDIPKGAKVAGLGIFIPEEANNNLETNWMPSYKILAKVHLGMNFPEPFRFFL